MEESRTQNEINQAEWKNTDNWSTIYFSKKDTRTWVPKKNLKEGSTINFGSEAGARWVYYLYLLFLLLGVFFGAIITYVIMGGS